MKKTKEQGKSIQFHLLHLLAISRLLPILFYQQPQHHRLTFIEFHLLSRWNILLCVNLQCLQCLVKLMRLIQKPSSLHIKQYQSIHIHLEWSVSWRQTVIKLFMRLWFYAFDVPWLNSPERFSFSTSVEG